MLPVNEILPDQLKTLDTLRQSIEKDADLNVQAEASTLQTAMESNNRSDVVTTLRTLEQRLDSLKAIDRHRDQLQSAKYSVGFVTDDIDTAAHGAAEMVVNPAVETIQGYVPGAKEAMEASKPTTDAMKEAYAKLPTSLRLPILGAMMGGGSWLLSYPVKWLGKLVGFVSVHGEEALERVARTMKKAGGVAVKGGLTLGALNWLGSLHRNGTFNGALDALKGGASISPEAAAAADVEDEALADREAFPKTATMAELESGMTFGKYTLKFNRPNTIVVNNVTYAVGSNSAFATGAEVEDLAWNKGKLTVKGVIKNEKTVGRILGIPETKIRLPNVSATQIVSSSDLVQVLENLAKGPGLFIPKNKKGEDGPIKFNRV